MFEEADLCMLEIRLTPEDSLDSLILGLIEALREARAERDVANEERDTACTAQRELERQVADLEEELDGVE